MAKLEKVDKPSEKFNNFEQSFPYERISPL